MGERKIKTGGAMETLSDDETMSQLSNKGKILQKKDPSLGMLLRMNVRYAKDISIETAKLDELDEIINEYSKQLRPKGQSLKKSVSSIFDLQSTQPKDRVLELKRGIAKLKKYVQSQNKSFNQMISENTMMKKKIDTVRQQRLVFKGDIQQVKDEMEGEKARMEHLTKEVEGAFVYRKEAETHMEEIKQKAEQEEEQIEEKWKMIKYDQEKYEVEQKQRTLVQRMIKHEQEKLESRQRSGMGQSMKLENSTRDVRRGREVQFIDTTNTRDFRSAESEDIGFLKREEERTKKQVMEKQKQVNQHEEAMRKIYEERKTHDIDKLIQDYSDMVATNLSLYNYTVQLADELDKLRKDRAESMKELEEMRQPHEHANKVQLEKLTQMKHEMSESEKLTEIYKSKYQKIILVINNLKIGIRNIYDNLGCKSTDLDILKTGVSDGTMLLYLAKIELRTNEILQMYDICQAKGDFEKLAVGTFGQHRNKAKPKEEDATISDNVWKTIEKPQPEAEREKDVYDEIILNYNKTQFRDYVTDKVEEEAKKKGEDKK